MSELFGFRARLGLFLVVFALALAAALTFVTIRTVQPALFLFTSVSTSAPVTDSIREVWTQAIVLQLVIAVSFALFGWIVAGRIARPMKQLADTARRIERGEVSPRMPELGERGEFAVLARALVSLVSLQVNRQREMAGLAAAHERALAERSEEYTREIDRLERVSGFDALTGLANRRQFDEGLEREWQRAIRYELPLALILVDIDHFKLYNDSKGHQAGDECLRRVGSALAQAGVRAGDLAARYGGEEFAVILTHTEESGARQAAGRIQATLKHYRIPHPSSPVANQVTLSMGVACSMPSAESSPAELIRRADVALYEAKEQGRNRVAVANPEPRSLQNAADASDGSLGDPPD